MVLAAVLLVTGIAVILLEFFIPAFGLIGIIGAASVIGSIVLAFRASSLAGSIFLILTLIIVPTMVFIFFKYFPRTYFGKKLILGNTFGKKEDNAPGPDWSVEGGAALLPGTSGRTVTDLRPSGSIRVDKNRYSALSAGEYIEKNKDIKIVRIEGNKIVVREEK
jgi:membrane-bound serine protease (ClpP class)